MCWRIFLLIKKDLLESMIWTFDIFFLQEKNIIEERI